MTYQRPGFGEPMAGVENNTGPNTGFQDGLRCGKLPRLRQRDLARLEYLIPCMPLLTDGQEPPCQISESRCLAFVSEAIGKDERLEMSNGEELVHRKLHL